jgi:hypothetical protein
MAPIVVSMKRLLGPQCYNVNICFVCPTASRGSAVAIANAYGLDDRVVGVRAPVGSRIFTSQDQNRLCGPHPTSYLMGTGVSFLGGKAVGA